MVHDHGNTACSEHRLVRTTANCAGRFYRYPGTAWAYHWTRWPVLDEAIRRFISSRLRRRCFSWRIHNHPRRLVPSRGPNARLSNGRPAHERPSGIGWHRMYCFRGMGCCSTKLASSSDGPSRCSLTVPLARREPGQRHGVPADPDIQQRVGTLCLESWYKFGCNCVVTVLTLCLNSWVP